VRTGLFIRIDRLTAESSVIIKYSFSILSMFSIF
jgi:hypothetical protein